MSGTIVMGEFSEQASPTALISARDHPQCLYINQILPTRTLPKLSEILRSVH